jgi:adenylate cyclase
MQTQRPLDWDESFDNALARAALEGDRRRMALVAGIVTVCMCAYLAALFVPGMLPGWIHDRFIQQSPYVLGIYTVALVYELGLRRWVGYCLRVGRVPPAWPRFVNAAVEMTLPTVLILLAAEAMSPVEALSAPPSAIYVILIMLLTLQLDGRVCAFAGFVAGLQYLIVALVLLSRHDATTAAGTNLLHDPIPHVLRGGMILLGGLAAAFVARLLRRQFEHSAHAIEDRKRAVGIFGQHVSPQVAERLLSQHRELGPEVREVCVMFLDIRNFTAFADGRSPAEVMDYLNRLFSPMIDTINQHGGIINKFLGDGFMAVFGAPMEDGQAPRHAVDAAMDLVKQVQQSGDDLPPTRIGIGLHAGPAVTGNLGSTGRKEYTVIGGVVNLASRLEQLNKQFDSQVLASQDVVEALPLEKCASATPLGEIPVRGQAAPVSVFRLA